MGKGELEWGRSHQKEGQPSKGITVAFPETQGRVAGAVTEGRPALQQGWGQQGLQGLRAGLHLPLLGTHELCYGTAQAWGIPRREGWGASLGGNKQGAPPPPPQAMSQGLCPWGVRLRVSEGLCSLPGLPQRPWPLAPFTQGLFRPVPQLWGLAGVTHGAPVGGGGASGFLVCCLHQGLDPGTSADSAQRGATVCPAASCRGPWGSSPLAPFPLPEGRPQPLEGLKNGLQGSLSPQNFQLGVAFLHWEGPLLLRVQALFWRLRRLWQERGSPLLLPSGQPWGHLAPQVLPAMPSTSHQALSTQGGSGHPACHTPVAFPSFHLFALSIHSSIGASSKNLRPALS